MLLLSKSLNKFTTKESLRSPCAPRKKKKKKEFAVLHVVLTGRANGGYAEGFIVPHGTNFPSEKDEIPQTRVGQSFGMHKIRRGVLKREFF